MSVHSGLERVRAAPFVLDAMAEADALAAACAVADGPRTVGLLGEAIADADDQLTAIAAIHGLARVFDDAADASLAELLSNPEPFVREHAAWALAARLPTLSAVGRLVGVVIEGGFAGMVAQRTLGRWARSAGDHVALALEGALAGVDVAGARARLVETVGTVPSEVAGRLLVQTATDAAEPVAVRIAAVAALGDRVDVAALDQLRLTAAGDVDVELAAALRLAVVDAGLAERRTAPTGDGSAGAGSAGAGSAGAGTTGAGTADRTVAQLFLHADIDADLRHAGAGDNGGVATLLVRLGDALVRTGGSDRVITMSRGTLDASADAFGGPAGGADAWSGPGGAVAHRFAPVPLPADATSIATAWPARLAAARGIRRVLRAAGPVDALHLRMADVGSLAAHEVAVELGIPVVFSLAPDPHAFIHALDMTGSLPRDRFGAIDAREHFWFRTRLVRRLAHDAAHRVLFPRPDVRAELHELLGIDVDAEPDRSTIVPEGIDLRVAEAAAAEVREPAGPRDDRPPATPSPTAPSPTAPSPALDELRDLVRALPAERHGLPLAISVGRLHRVKGMATVVEAWASQPELRQRCNLVIVGGELTSPSADEREQLETIAAVLDEHPSAREGVVLAGHRPNDVVARWLAAAAHGSTPEVGTHGVYVCGSLKEEFGLALLEALAAGLPVVAPHGGGPATYVEAGVTGVLVDTRSPAEVAAGMLAALDIAPNPGRAERALSTVRERFTIEAMATTLGSIYGRVAGREHVETGRPVASVRPTTSDGPGAVVPPPAPGHPAPGSSGPDPAAALR